MALSLGVDAEDVKAEGVSENADDGETRDDDAVGEEEAAGVGRVVVVIRFVQVVERRRKRHRLRAKILV